MFCYGAYQKLVEHVESCEIKVSKIYFNFLTNQKEKVLNPFCFSAFKICNFVLETAHLL